MTQRIVTFLVEINGRIKCVTWRSSEIPQEATIGASDWALRTSPRPLTTPSPDLWIGDLLQVKRDGEDLGSFKILAKEDKEWDYSKPKGERCISRRTSKQWQAWRDYQLKLKTA